MTRSRPPTTGDGVPTPRGYLLLLAALCCGTLLLGCAPADDTGDPAAEETGETDPSQAQTVDETGKAAVTPVSVDLPGLPVGGDDAELTSAAPSACVRVNWTAGTLLDGVSVAIRQFADPAPFAFSSDPCSSTPAPCLGSVLTAASTWCEVGIAYLGPVTESGAASLSVVDAELTCQEQALCDQTLGLIAAEGEATIGLFFEPDVVPPSEEVVTPSEEIVTPSEEAVSPSEEVG